MSVHTAVYKNSQLLLRTSQTALFSLGTQREDLGQNKDRTRTIYNSGLQTWLDIRATVTSELLASLSPSDLVSLGSGRALGSVEVWEVTTRTDSQDQDLWKSETLTEGSKINLYPV